MNNLGGDQPADGLQWLTRGDCAQIPKGRNTGDPRSMTPNIGGAESSRKGNLSDDASRKKRMIVQSAVKDSNDRRICICWEDRGGILKIHLNEFVCFKIRNWRQIDVGNFRNGEQRAQCSARGCHPQQGD